MLNEEMSTLRPLNNNFITQMCINSVVNLNHGKIQYKVWKKTLQLVICRTSQTYHTVHNIDFQGALDIFVHGSKIDLGIVLYMLIKLICKEIQMSQLILS